LKARAALRARTQGWRARDQATPYESFRGVDDDTWFWLNTEGSRRFEAVRRMLPTLPDEGVQKRFTGGVGDESIRSAFAFYGFPREALTRYRPELEQPRVLDYGCGWGRVTRLFLRDTPADRIVGIDCTPSAIETSRATNRWTRFELVDPLPPTGLPAGTFDLVTCYSVFSHLSEPAHEQWLEELHRLLAPKGLLVASTWGRRYIEECEMSRQGTLTDMHLGAKRAFVGTDEWLERYDAGQFCHSPVGGGESLPSEFYGETCIPRSYVEAHWTRWFTLLEYVSDRSRLWQDVIIMQKAG
jgi:2-polyprenyl-3-methyl-5-hydroxy-6-metoxy-1,4-benzoquinol methylase